MTCIHHSTHFYMKKVFFVLLLSCVTMLAQAQSQTTRYYVVYSSCFCDPSAHSVSSDAKPKQHLFISNVQTSVQNDRNESKLKDRFRNQIKIEFDNWTELEPFFVEDFSTSEEASDFRREKMAEEKTQRKAQFHYVNI